MNNNTKTNTIMKRKEYQEQTMEIVKLKQRYDHMDGSQQSAEGVDFTWDEDWRMDCLT